MDDDAAYLALSARDARFDGRFFVGVTSTGIYCRPVCRVRLPKRANCRFFPSAPRAEEAGFRPCLRCRPESAPGWSTVDASATLARQAATRIEQGVRDGQVQPLSEVARDLGVSDRHLRRIFLDTHGVTPSAYEDTQRRLLAKRLLSDTTLPFTQVALLAGFGSVRRFNASMAQHYRLTPTAIRASVRSSSARARSASHTVPSRNDDAIRLDLSYRPPYDTAAMFAFLSRRQVDGLESVEGHTLRRTLHIGMGPSSEPLTGWIEACFAPDQAQVRLRVSAGLAPRLASVLAAVRHGLDLDADPALIDAALQPHWPDRYRPGLRVAGAFEGFEAAARIVLGQQVTVAAARTLTGRLVRAFGAPVNTPWAAVDRAFPTAACIAGASAEEIGQLGIVRQRVRALQSLARAVRSGLRLTHEVPLEPTMAALLGLPGIGPWTAELIAMRCLAWPDAFPATDVGLYQALGHRNAAEADRQSQAWRPWRSYAVMQLWTMIE